MNAIPSLLQNQLTNWFLRRTPAMGVRRVASLTAAIATDQGNVREENQDRVAIARGWDRQGRDYALVIVADGIGGMASGGACAALTIGSFIASVDQQAQNFTGSFDQSEKWLLEAAHAANQAVFSKYRASGGSTLVALLVRSGTKPHWLSIGDSRVYCSDEEGLNQVSIDDTIAGQLGKNPEEFTEQSRLLQFVGMGADLEPHVSILSNDSANAVILTTDGVHYLAPSPGWLSQIISHSPDPGVCVKRLIDLAKWCGGPDNATVAFIALPVEIVPEYRPPFPCVEVWDAYGELQIISPSPVLEQLSPLGKHEPLLGNVTAQNPRQIPHVDVQTDALPIPAVPEPSKSRRGKSSRKLKKSPGKLDKDLEKTSEPELPQLHMEFPEKSE